MKQADQILLEIFASTLDYVHVDAIAEQLGKTPDGIRLRMEAAPEMFWQHQFNRDCFRVTELGVARIAEVAEWAR